MNVKLIFNYIISILCWKILYFSLQYNIFIIIIAISIITINKSINIHLVSIIGKRMGEIK